MAKILIVDDERVITFLLQETLLEAGHDVLTAGSGEEGLAAAIEARPHLVVSDVCMPGMNGFEMIERINVQLPATRCLMMSGNAFMTPATSARELARVRLDAVLRKPFGLRSFVQEVELSLARGNDRPAPAEV